VVWLDYWLSRDKPKKMQHFCSICWCAANWSSGNVKYTAIHTRPRCHLQQFLSSAFNEMHSECGHLQSTSYECLLVRSNSSCKVLLVPEMAFLLHAANQSFSHQPMPTWCLVIVGHHHHLLASSSLAPTDAVGLPSLYKFRLLASRLNNDGAWTQKAMNSLTLLHNSCKDTNRNSRIFGWKVVGVLGSETYTMQASCTTYTRPTRRLLPKHSLGGYFACVAYLKNTTDDSISQMNEELIEQCSSEQFVGLCDSVVVKTETEAWIFSLTEIRTTISTYLWTEIEFQT